MEKKGKVEQWKGMGCKELEGEREREKARREKRRGRRKGVS